MRGGEVSYPEIYDKYQALDFVTMHPRPCLTGRMTNRCGVQTLGFRVRVQDLAATSLH